MKIRHLIAILTVVFLGISFAHAATADLGVKAGDDAYVCPCKSKSCCEVAAVKPGKCGCGHDLAKVTVTRVKGKKAFYEAAGKEQAFKLTGKYTCGCGGDCCKMVSQKPGKCNCGKELVKAGKAK